jgi:D-xylose 1-dehydrogenase (NADP+, D-xylono-1,5-lactone-forming)
MLRKGERFVSTKIRWGIISTAKIGRTRVVPAIQQSSNGVVAAVASRDLGKAREYADELNIPKAYGSYEELIADPEIDAIYNPLPNSEHALWSIRCAEAGKSTLCEKPLATDAAEAKTMVDAFVQRGVPFTEGFMYRFHPQNQKVKQLVDSGALGDIKVILSSFSFVISDEENIRLSKPLAGGSLMDVGCYCVNVMRLMTGEEPVSAKAVQHVGTQSGVDETFSGVLTFPSGTFGHFDSSLRTHFSNQYDIRGTKGRVFVGESFVPGADATTIVHHWSADGLQTYRIEPANQYTLMIEDFDDALLNNHAPRFDPYDGVKTMQAIDMLYASARG